MRHLLNSLSPLLVGAIALVGMSIRAQAQGRKGPPAESMSPIGKPGALTAVETAFLNAMKDENIVAHLIFADSAEAAMSQAVAQNADRPAVREFARALASDHARALARDRALVGGLRGLPRLSPADTADPRMLGTMDTRFRGLAADSLDQSFVSAQLLHHVHIVNELGTLRAIAMSANVQQQIDNELPVERTHLTRAQSLARSLGLPSP